MVKSRKEVRTDYKELANVVRQHTRQGYVMESAHCNPQNLKEIVCTFSRVSINAYRKKRRTTQEPKKRGARKRKV